MADDINVRIALTGEQKFREAINKINAGLKVNQSELKLVTAQYGKTSSSIEGLQAHSKALEGAILSQKDKISILEEELKNAVARYGEAGARTLELQADLNKANASLHQYSNALAENNKQLKDARTPQEEHADNVRDTGEAYEEAEKKAVSFADIVKASAIGNLVASGIKKAIGALKQFGEQGAQAAKDYETNVARLTQVMQNMIGATSDQVNSVLSLIEQEERLGVVSKQAQTAAAQELATYTTKRQSLEKLIPVLNNMIVQQYKVNASQENAVSIATGLGKALDGQIGSLQRWGYSFTESEQRILKGNNELKKLDAIAQSVNRSVGGMNYTLRETTEEGRNFGKMLELGAAQEKFGKNIDQIKNNLLYSLIPALTTTMESINDFTQNNGKALEALGGVVAAVATTLVNLLNLISKLPSELILTIASILLAVKTFSSMTKGLEVLKPAFKFFTFQLDDTAIKVVALVAAISVLLFLVLSLKEGTEKAAQSMKALGNTAGNLVQSHTNSARTNAYATGTHSAKRGLAWVGERGPELVMFRGGERVWNARESAVKAGGPAGGYTDNRSLVVNTDNDRTLQEIKNWWRNQRRTDRGR